MDSTQPSANQFDARAHAPVNKNDNSVLLKFLKAVTANDVWIPNVQPIALRPTRRTEITGVNDEDGIPAPSAPAMIFDNNFGDFGSDKFPQLQPPSPPPLLTLTPSSPSGFEQQPTFIATFQPITFSECSDCMYDEEVRNRPPFPIYNPNYNFVQMNAMIARDDRTVNVGGYIISNQPVIWE